MFTFILPFNGSLSLRGLLNKPLTIIFWNDTPSAKKQKEGRITTYLNYETGIG